MGAEQQGNRSYVLSKDLIAIAAQRSRIHLELVMDRKNAQIRNIEKEFLTKLQRGRNQLEEQLTLERLVQCYKYAEVCKILSAYCNTIRDQAHLVAENLNNTAKIAHLLPLIYSIIAGANQLELFSLVEFSQLMKDLNNPNVLQKYVVPEVAHALTPFPDERDINNYVINLLARNNINLQFFNQPGHRFTHHFEQIPSNPPPSKAMDPSMNQQKKNQYPVGGQHPDPVESFASKPVGLQPSLSPQLPLGPQEPVKPVEIYPNLDKPISKVSSPGVPSKQLPESNRDSINKFGDLDFHTEMGPDVQVFNPSFDQICRKLKEVL